MRRIIFLDIDGVLNSEIWYRRRAESRCEGHDGMIDPALVGLVNQLVDRTGAKVVVSSTWRFAGLEAIRATLRLRGLLAEVIGITPVMHHARGIEIQAWIDDQQRDCRPAGIVIIDDDSDMRHLSRYLVKTSFATGITQANVDAAVEVLRRPFGVIEVANA